MSKTICRLLIASFVALATPIAGAQAQDKPETPKQEPAATPKTEGKDGDKPATPEQPAPAPTKEWGYLGTPIREWVKVYRKAQTDKERVLALKAFSESGKNGVVGAPILLEVARDPGSVQVKKGRRNNKARKAAQYYAVVGLGKMGIDHYRPLLEDINSDEFMVSANALKLLGYIKPVHKDSVAAVTTKLGAKSSILRSSAADSLARMGEPAIDALATVLDSNDTVAKTYACVSLGNIGKPAARVIDKIAKQLDPKNTALCVAAANAIAEFGPESAKALPQLIEAFKADSPAVKSAALRCLSSLGPKAADAVPLLLEYYDAKNPGRRLMVIRVLGKIGPNAKAGVPILIKELDSRRLPQILKEACIALSSMRELAAPALPKLLEIFVDNKISRSIRIEAGRGIARIGAKNPEVVKGVKAVFDDRNAPPDVRVMAARIFGDINATEHKEYLVEALGTENDEVMIMALKRSIRKLYKGKNNKKASDKKASDKKASDKKADQPKAAPQPKPDSPKQAD